MDFIGLQNNTRVSNIKFNIKYRILITSNANNGKQDLKISLSQISISGNTVLREFNIDSLLWPTAYIAKLEIRKNNSIIETINIAGNTSGKLSTTVINNHISNIENINIAVSEIKFYYIEDQYFQVRNLSKKISYYYSYGKLLNILIKEYTNNSQKSSISAEKVFINKVEIDRVSGQITKHNLATSLKLNINDPVNLLKLVKKTKRLSKRTETLFVQQLSNSKASNLLPLVFCNLYCNLSSSFLQSTKNLQPTDASGFEEAAKINKSASAKQNLIQISNYYSKNTSISAKTFFQTIFNKFVDKASNAIGNNNYTNALLYLNNALIINDWFSANLTPNYKLLVYRALNGVSASYLKVGLVALKAQNQLLANTYFNRADEIIITNSNIFKSINLYDTVFTGYLKLQYQIAEQFNNNGEYDNAFIRLKFANVLCNRSADNDACNRINSATANSYSGLINKKLDKLDKLISEGQYPESHKQLSEIWNELNFNYLIKKDSLRLNKLSYSLAIEYIQQGEILFDANQSEMALYYLLKAKSIQSNYINGNFSRLDNLIKLAAEPEIIKLIDQANYHTWANRMDEANEMYNKAYSQTQKYFSNSNITLNTELASLKNRIASRKCISYEIKYNDAIKKIHIAIKYKNYNKLNQLLTEAFWYINTYPECNINNSAANELMQKYNPVIEYYIKYDSVIKLLYNNGYYAAIENLIDLNNYFDDYKISDYEISRTSVKEFIITQNIKNLTLETANYLTNNNEYTTGLEYIKIYKQQGGNPKTAKKITNVIAKNLAKNDETINKPTKDALQEYTNNDRWFNLFKIAYLKHRIIN